MTTDAVTRHLPTSSSPSSSLQTRKPRSWTPRFDIDPTRWAHCVGRHGSPRRRLSASTAASRPSVRRASSRRTPSSWSMRSFSRKEVRALHDAAHLVHNLPGHPYKLFMWLRVCVIECLCLIVLWVYVRVGCDLWWVQCVDLVCQFIYLSTPPSEFRQTANKCCKWSTTTI